MSQQDFQIEAYRDLTSGQRNLRVRSLLIRQLLPEQGEVLQSVELVLQAEREDMFAMSFEGVRDLRIADLHPGVVCCLQINNIASRRWEDVKYDVHNGEQDFTLSFYCREFRAAKMAR